MKVVGKKYASVSELVRDTSDPDFANDFDKHLSERRLVKGLTVLRCVKGLSQEELAGRMGCGQPKVSKMESSADGDLNFGDIVAYANAMQLVVRIALTPGRFNGADRVRFHINCLKHELNELVRLAGDDKKIGAGVETFAIEQMQKMVKVMEDAISKLPNRREQADSVVCVEVEGEHGERLPLDGPKRRIRTSRKVTSAT